MMTGTEQQTSPGTRVATPGARVHFRPRSDLVTFEVLRHRLWQINDEQGQTLLNVSGSPVASEANDFNITIADRDGNLIAVGPYILVHLSSLSLMIRHAQRVIPHDQMADGDMYLVNDPWSGAVHQNDAGLIAPVFHDGELVAWVGSVVHQVDVGGPQPGSWNPFAQQTFDEAPRYKFLKAVRAGLPQPEVIETFVTNSRLPHLVELDLRAQIASAHVARARLFELFDRYGTGTVLDVMQDVLDYSETLLRHKLRDLPDGRWSAEDYLDHDGHRDRIYTVRLILEKVEDTLTFDFRGTDPQADGFVNCTYSSLLGGVFSAVLPYLCTDIPWNAGVMRPVSILAEEGTIHHARFPAAVGAGPVNAGWVTHNTAAATLAKLLSASEAHRENAMALWTGASFLYNLFGQNQYGRPFGTMMLSSTLGGGGARSFADGYNCAGPLTAPRPSVINVESAEALFPLLYLYRRRARDSGGAGQFRGGLSAENAVVVYAVEHTKAIVSTLGTNHTSGLGIAGGYPGAGSTGILIEDAAPLALIARGAVPAEATAFPGRQRYLPSKCVLELRAGDLLVTVAHGGGGYGDPLRRDLQAVERDVREGLVSIGQARALYGAVLDAEGRSDVAATIALRARLRHERAVTTSPVAVPSAEDGEARPWLSPRLSEARGAVVCAGCHTALGPAHDNPKRGMTRRVFPLSRAGPWIARRYDGDSPDFKLEEYACPGCGELFTVEVRPVSEAELWWDVRPASRTE